MNVMTVLVPFSDTLHEVFLEVSTVPGGEVVKTFSGNEKCFILARAEYCRLRIGPQSMDGSYPL